MLQICKLLFELWNKDVRYCHWKSNEHLIEGLQGTTDLDVFVLPEDRSLAEKKLKQCKYIKFTPQDSSRYPMVDEWIGFDESTGKLVHVHLHYRIITGTKFCKEYVFPMDKMMIDYRILDPETNVFIAAPEVELIVLFSRIVLKSRNKSTITTMGYDAEISYLKQRVDINKLKVFCDSAIGKEGSLYYDIIIKDVLNKHDWTTLVGIIHRWLDKYRTKSRLQCFFRTNFYWSKFYSDLVLNRLFHTPTLSKKTLPGAHISICFLGQDGSGKSTLSMNVEKWLRWKIEAHRFYLGSGEHFHSPIKWMLRKISSAKNKNNTSQDKQHSLPETKTGRKFGFSSWIGMMLASYELKNIAKRALKEIKKAYSYSGKGGVSIYDRFPQIQFPGIYDGPKIRKIYIEKDKGNWFVERMAKLEEQYLLRVQQYQPTLVFKLMLSPEESISRKPFENFEQVREKHEITKQISFPQSEVYEIDATQDYEQELLIVKRNIWECFLKNQLS